MVSVARAWMWRAVYEALGARVRTPDWAFMNYGYAPPDGAGRPSLEPAAEPDRLCIQLYEVTRDGVDLAGLDVLEVGSGRGGGAEHLARRTGARTVTGLDFSRSAVRLANRHRKGPGLRFVVGDAQATGLPDAGVDVVVNVESSHCYPSMERFVAEAYRVLRPGGHLLWADLRRREDVAPTLRALAAPGFTTLAQEDITDGVLRALRLDDERKEALVRAWIPRPFRRAIRPFAGLEGTRNVVGFSDGSLCYLRAHLVKPHVTRS